MNGGLDGSASGERGKIYPSNHTIVEGRNLLFMLSVFSVILNPSPCILDLLQSLGYETKIME